MRFCGVAHDEIDARVQMFSHLWTSFWDAMEMLPPLHCKLPSGDEEQKQQLQLLREKFQMFLSSSPAEVKLLPLLMEIRVS